MSTQALLNLIFKILPTKLAYAHCDVPCGIYDPKSAQIAAETVLKMTQLIEGLPKENLTVDEHNKFVRCVITKEEHARKCKEEILILWTDFFKPEHLEMFPNLHDTFWKAAKLCSDNKQHANTEKARELVNAVNEIAEIFQKAKSSSKK
jgi:nickel superoxide dismutase